MKEARSDRSLRASFLTTIANAELAELSRTNPARTSDGTTA